MGNLKPVPIGQVIRILDSYTLLVNAGKDKLSVDDKIQVYTIGSEIKDLDGKILGYQVCIKDELIVTQVEDAYSVCEKKCGLLNDTYDFLSTSPLLEDSFTLRSPLSINDNEVEPFPEIDRMIHVGDSIKFS